MKTLTYLPTLLALTIQVMVSGQTHDNQARKIRVDIMGPKEPVKMNYTNSNITLSITEYNQLIEQANNLKFDAKKLREEAELTDQKVLIKQIEASKLSAQISSHKFEENKKTILVFFTKIPQNNSIHITAKQTHLQSEHLMKLAHEIREEASAQLTIQAQYGSMSNAEEKENLALIKQQEVLAMFANYNSQELHQPSVGLDEEKAGVDNLSNRTKQITSVIASDETVQNSEQLMEKLYDALKQADDMKVTAQELRETAINVSVNEKSLLINEAINLENEYLAKRVEVSNLKAKLMYDKFLQNRQVIERLINSVTNNDLLVNAASQLNIEAERLLKIGKEMREEANAQLTNSAKYGAVSNAEESERIALGKQEESIQFIEKSNSQLVIASR